MHKLKNLSDATIEAEHIFKIWFILPIKPQRSRSNALMYFKAKLSPLQIRELELNTFILQLDRIKGMDYEDDFVEGWKNKPISMAEVDDVDIGIEDDQAEAEECSIGSPSIRTKKSPVKKGILKNAQQTDEYKMQSTTSNPLVLLQSK